MVHLLLRCSLHREENISISFMQCSHEELSFFKGILFFFMEWILCHAKLHRVIRFVFPKCQGCQSTSLVMKSALVPSAAGCCRFPVPSWFMVIWVLPGQLAPLHNGGSGRLSPAYQHRSWSSAGLPRSGKPGHRCPPLHMAGSGGAWWALWCQGAPRRALSCIGCAEIQVLSRVRPGSRLQEVDLWCKDL